jgi:hypothetical protein
MPDWQCPKCGERVENFSWEEKPWNSHVCREIRKEPIKSPYADMGDHQKRLGDFS